MGVSRKWLKSLVGRKKSPQAKKVVSKQEPITPKKARRWSFLACHAIDQGSIIGGDDEEEIENSASGNNAKAPGIVMSQAEREEWAAIRIQTASRTFLAKRALCALKGLARLQAALSSLSGHTQSKTSLRSIQTFVRMQARICAHRALKKKGGLVATQRISTYPVDSQATENEGQEEWCDALGSVEDIQARAQHRQEAAIKRDRALAYAFSNQWRANSKLNLESLFDDKLDNSTWSWAWLDRWLSSQPAVGRSSTPTSKSDVQAFILKKSASLGMKRSPRSSINASKGDHSGLVRAKSHGAGSTLRLPLGSKKQAAKSKAERPLKQREWRSLSNPKQRLIKEVKRRNSLPNGSRKSPSRGAANLDQSANGILASDGGKKI